MIGCPLPPAVRSISGQSCSHLLRADEDRVDAERLVEQGPLPLEAEGVLGVGEPEEPAARHQQVVVELAREIAVQVEALLEEGDRLGHLVVRAEDRGVPPRRAGADVAALEHADAGDPVARGEVVRGREAVAAAADDDDVVARARLGCAQVGPGGGGGRSRGDALLEPVGRAGSALDRREVGTGGEQPAAQVVREHRGDGDQQLVRADDDLRRDVCDQALEGRGRVGERNRREPREGVEPRVAAHRPDRMGIGQVDDEAARIEARELRLECGELRPVRRSRAARPEPRAPASRTDRRARRAPPGARSSRRRRAAVAGPQARSRSPSGS